MRSWYLLLWAIASYLLPLAGVAGQSIATEPGRVNHATISTLSGQTISFTENVGQWPDSILFRASAGRTTMWFVRDGIYYQFTRRIPKTLSGEEALAAGLGPRQALPDRFNREPDSIETDMVKAQFLGANPRALVVGVEEQEYKCNYFLGNDPSRWQSNVPNYSGVTFKDIYPGVEATFRGNNGRLEYELQGPAEELAKVRISYGSAVTAAGDLAVVQTNVGEKMFRNLLPVSDASPVIAASPSSSEAVVLAYSTYLGRSDWDYGWAIAVDSFGSAYVTGNTLSTDFPTHYPYQPFSAGRPDAFVTKLSPSGSSVIFSTYLGGNAADEGYGIAVDAWGCSYVTGRTYSTNYPTQSPFQTDPGDASPDAFVTKLTADGDSLLYSTYLGGTGDDWAWDIAENGSGIACVTGETYSTDFPLMAFYQSDQPAADGFVTELLPSGSGLAWSTYLGGNGADGGFGIAADSETIWLTGGTESSDFPVLAPYQASCGGSFDAFVTVFISRNLHSSTYLGGSGSDHGRDIAVESAIAPGIYVTGTTQSTDFDTLNTLQVDQPGQDAFVTKFSLLGDTLCYSTYLGGSGIEEGRAIAVTDSGQPCVTGVTRSSDFPAVNAIQTYQGNVDAYVIQLGSSGSDIRYSTYLGGNNTDQGLGIAVTGDDAYVTGFTISDNFPTQNPYQTDQLQCDAFVTKLASPPPDSDQDGIPDEVDNCPWQSNPLQEDMDNDGMGDVCDSCPSQPGEHCYSSFWGAASQKRPDEVCPAWEPSLTGDPAPPALVGDTLLLSTSATNQDAYYFQALGSTPTCWTIEFRMRYISGSTGNMSHLPLAIYFAGRPDLANYLFIGTDSIHMWDEIGEIGPGAHVETDDTFHTYRISIRDSSVTVYYDGNPVLYGLALARTFEGPGLKWGDLSASSYSTSEWLYFRHDGYVDTDGDGVVDCCDNCPLTQNTIQADANADGVGDACQGSAAITPEGSNVIVSPASGVSLTFDTVSAGGVTEVRQSNTGVSLPEGFSIYPTSCPIWYQIETGVSYAGSVQICLHYNEDSLHLPEDTLVLFHYTSGGWVNITTSRDTVGNYVCGTTTNLSPFVLAEPHCCTNPTGNVNMTGIVDLSDLSMLIAYLTASPRPTLPCPAEANVNAIGIVDLSDLSLLIAYLTATPRPTLPNCP